LLSKNLKIKIYRTIVLPIVLYGCETWLLTLREERRLRLFENRVLRRIFGSGKNEDMIHLLTAIGLSPGGSTHLHKNNTYNNTNNNRTTQITNVVTGEWRRLHNEETDDLYSSPDSLGDKIKKNEMGGACSLYEREERHI